MQPETTQTPTETRESSLSMEPKTTQTPTETTEASVSFATRSDSELSEGVRANSAAFSKNLSNFYILHTLKCGNKTRGGSDTLKFIGLSVLCLFVVTVQFVSLYMLSYAFEYWTAPFYVEYGGERHLSFDMFGQLYPHRLVGNIGLHMVHQQYTYRNSLTPPFKEDIVAYFDYAEEGTFKMPTFDLFVWSLTVFTLVLCGFLSKSIASSVSSLWICFSYDDDDRYPRGAYFYIMSMFLKALNLALIFCVFVFIVNVLCFALYFGVATITMDWRVFLFPIVAVCIVRFDEWAFEWSVVNVERPNDFWSVTVTKHYAKTHKKLMTVFVFLYISWAFAWYLASNQLYYWNGGVWYLNSYKLITLAILCGVMLLLLPMKSSIFRFIVHHFVGDIFVMLLSFVAAFVMYHEIQASYEYVVEWSYDLMLHHFQRIDIDSFDTYKAPINATGKSVPNIQRISVAAMVFCGLNFVLFVHELYRKHSMRKYRLFLSLMAPLMCLSSYIYYLVTYGLLIVNVYTQFFVLFSTPVIIVHACCIS